MGAAFFVPAGFATLAVFAAPSSALAAQICEPARLATDPAALPAPWQRALSDVIEATARPGLPWSCHGGILSLDLEADGAATLTVVDADGHARARHLATADDLVPMAEALLAKPLDPPVAIAVPPAAPTSPPKERDQPTLPAPPAEPRLLVDVLIGPRYAGRTNIMWGGLTFRAAVPFGAWLAGAWVRYDGAGTELGPDRHVPLPNEVCFGATAGRRFTTTPIELSASFDPSLAVVGQRSGHKRDTTSETRVDGRLGLSLRASKKILRPLRVLVAIDGELAPGELMDHEPPPTPTTTGDRPPPPFPSFTLGLTLGAEFVLR